MEEITDYKLLLDTAVLAGEVMLRSGAEVYRVEDTIHRMLAVSGLKTTEAYVTATGLIVTLDDPEMDSLTVVRRIRNRDTNLSQIAETNQISRRFCTGDLTLKEAFRELKHLQVHPYTQAESNFSAVLVAGFFAVLLGGTVADGVAAGIVGVALVYDHTSAQCVHCNCGFFCTDGNSETFSGTQRYYRGGWLAGLSGCQ